MREALRSALICAIIGCVAFQLAHADGGRLRFSKAAGPFLVTLFTTPEPLTAGPVDFSVMVQDAATGQILPDAVVAMSLDRVDSRTLSATASHQHAVNRLLQAGEINLPSAGVWQMHLHVSQAGREADCDTAIEVQPGSRKTYLVWIFAMLPLIAVLLFWLHQAQKLKRQQRR